MHALNLVDKIEKMKTKAHLFRRSNETANIRKHQRVDSLSYSYKLNIK